MPQNATARGEIFVLDDDAAMRETLTIALQEDGYDVICFVDGAALLSLARTRIPACIFLEVRIPGKSGLEILKTLHAENYPAPVFVISGQGDIPMAVDAIRNGALDFIEKPHRSSEIVARVKAAIGTLSRQLPNRNSSPKIPILHLPGREPLTRRERDVLAQLADGASNKQAGRQLGLSPRTIEGHRAKIMKKVGVRNLAELVRRVLSESRNSALSWEGPAESSDA
jgi:FixJ family two-component response regulator